MVLRVYQSEVIVKAVLNWAAFFIWENTFYVQETKAYPPHIANSVQRAYS